LDQLQIYLVETLPETSLNDYRCNLVAFLLNIKIMDTNAIDKGNNNYMPVKKLFLFSLVLFSFFLACQSAEDESKSDGKLKIVATIFPVYDFARNIGGNRVNVTMLLPPATDAHNYELKPEDIVKVSKADIFLFTNFEMEQWAYKIIKAAGEKTNVLAVETGRGTVLLPLTDVDEHEKHISKFDPHIWLDLDNAQRMVDNIASAFIKKDSRHSDYYLINAREYKRKLIALDQRYRTELVKCQTKTILHAGHWAFAYLARKYDLIYIAAYNASADAEPSPQNIFALVEKIKGQNVPYIYYEDLVAPRLAQTIAQETGAGLLKLSNGHDISKKDMSSGLCFISLMEDNLNTLKKGMQCR
jgi:zinc transport system substrate-binding protein